MGWVGSVDCALMLKPHSVVWDAWLLLFWLLQGARQLAVQHMLLPCVCAAGGSNVPALNDMLTPYGAAFAAGVLASCPAATCPVPMLQSCVLTPGGPCRFSVIWL